MVDSMPFGVVGDDTRVFGGLSGESHFAYSFMEDDEEPDLWNYDDRVRFLRVVVELCESGVKVTSCRLEGSGVGSNVDVSLDEAEEILVEFNDGVWSYVTLMIEEFKEKYE